MDVTPVVSDVTLMQQKFETVPDSDVDDCLPMVDVPDEQVETMLAFREWEEEAHGLVHASGDDDDDAHADMDTVTGELPLAALPEPGCGSGPDAARPKMQRRPVNTALLGSRRLSLPLPASQQPASPVKAVPSAEMYVALYGRGSALAHRLQAHFGSFWFTDLAKAETGLFTSAVYAVFNQDCGLVRVSPKRPARQALARIAAEERQDPAGLFAVRLVLFGTELMFSGLVGPRHFFYDFQTMRARYLLPAQEFILVTAQHLLNRSAPWFVYGSSGRSGLSPTASPLSTPPASPPVRMAGTPQSPGTPALPGQSPPTLRDDEMTLLPGSARSAALLWFASGQIPLRSNAPQPGQDWRYYLAPQELPPAVVERLAMENLRRLGNAQVPQAGATLFMDAAGQLQHVLWGRPDSAQLSFMDDEEEILSVIRISLGDSGSNVEVAHPLGPLTAPQRQVLQSMRNILQAFAASSAGDHNA
jgi:hypothetical protein